MHPLVGRSITVGRHHKPSAQVERQHRELKAALAATSEAEAEVERLRRELRQLRVHEGDEKSELERLRRTVPSCAPPWRRVLRAPSLSLV